MEAPAQLQRHRCYTCNKLCNIQRMTRILVIDGDADNVAKIEIVFTRRETFGLPPIPMNEVSRLCINCNRSILEELRILANDPTCLRLNVLKQTSNVTCLICNNANNLQRLSLKCRVNIFICKNIYAPESARACIQHLDENEFILRPLLEGLEFINRPYKIKGPQMYAFLQELRTASDYKRWEFHSENSFSDEEFKSMSPVDKQQFQNLFTYCDVVGSRHISKKDLLAFLCKMKQGLSDDFLKVIFNYSTRQNASLAISKVRSSLMVRFVPENIGLIAINRQQFIERHVTPFANRLYNPNPEQPKAIVYVDGTYCEIQKSKNFQVLRQSYCVHKGHHLIKPALIVGPNGYILTIQGPYFSDTRNNDAAMLRNEYQRDTEMIRNWFQENDIFVVDRGYRDAIPMLRQLGIDHRIPSNVRAGELQLSVEEANTNRLITKTRWIVEARNGHFKSIFNFFSEVISVHHAVHLGEFYKICGAIINKYHDPVVMRGADIAQAENLLERSREENRLKVTVENENLLRRHGRFVSLENNHIPDFPRLTLEYLRDLTVGTYQLKLAPSYIQDTTQRERNDDLQIDVANQLANTIRLRIWSRFQNRVKHQIWIEYGHEIIGYYCTCKSGARTVGTCSHVASVLWFLGYSRFENNIKYPSPKLLEHIADAANRHNNHHDDIFVIIE